MIILILIQPGNSVKKKFKINSSWKMLCMGNHLESLRINKGHLKDWNSWLKAKVMIGGVIPSE